MQMLMQVQMQVTSYRCMLRCRHPKSVLLMQTQMHMQVGWMDGWLDGDGTASIPNPVSRETQAADADAGAVVLSPTCPSTYVTPLPLAALLARACD